MRAIEVCRTAALGGHVEQCNGCGFVRPAYNSCRNRHCPKCQALSKARWLQAQETEQLPVPSFHLVFTVPHEVNALALYNKKEIYDILFQSAAQTLQAFAADPQAGLGGQIGITAILHTWDQTLNHHIHLHCAVPAGALSFDRRQWIPARQNFLFPVKALSSVFRGKFLHKLKTAHQKGQLVFPGTVQRHAFQTFRHALYQKQWLVYAKPGFAGRKGLLDYIGRYTHRIALSNNRLRSVANGQVAFAYRDRRDQNKKKNMSLPAEEFIHRFLRHTLPPAFVRIRHFGFYANRHKKTALACCRKSLGLDPTIPKPAPKTTAELIQNLTGTDITRCPQCQHGKMQLIAEIPKPSFLNTS